jgi:aerobic-type carbon monoxide dehydrogenase small subunit (CoxS/CutS family)
MAQYNLKINGNVLQVEADPTTPVLWVLRDNLKMLGTKFGCGMAQCGACTIHIDGTAMRSCVYPVSAVDGQSITTIEAGARRAAVWLLSGGADYECHRSTQRESQPFRSGY